ncbi:MAG: DUF2384 domain-containing protein [Betaproteobacteria bacterium]|nr:DUF2384 domain-containing protein [Betaproteobacteria bacterium]
MPRHASLAAPLDHGKRHADADADADATQVLAKATLRAASLLGLSGRELAEVIGSSESTVSRMAAGMRALAPRSKPGQLAALLIRVYRSLDALVGNDAQARLRWMRSYNDALGTTPLQALRSPEGLVRVLTYLDGARALA